MENVYVYSILTSNLKERANLEDLGVDVKLLYVTRNSSQSKHNLMIQINTATCFG